ncbi:membrane protein DedA, SNARE-associated domain [Asanoa hainanensis]|uniref:Membrane protein DedA, SNARE-associated domain n=1 Tax=Asanoa hainanensis TaxID=560556 RepID=A0A239MCQ1_9ACTN|nr:DedA family protein [Asanoa hainanensis]SNT39824.1 membrane protein DedA, SNARE-associated domain [Asanoa hainanensis]
MDGFLDFLDPFITSPWVYGVVFALAALDAFLPIVPSEATLITAGVFAASGEPNVILVILVGAVGAMVGDHISYFIGRAGGENVINRIPEGSRRAKTFEWVRQLLYSHGGIALVIARYIPGGRTAITLTTGAIRYPQRRFTAFDALACFSWAAYTTLLGFLGGSAFQDHPIQGLALGFGIALGLAGLAELIQWLRHRRRPPPEKPEPQKVGVGGDGK